MSFSSVPAPRPQPDTAAYGIGALSLLTQFARDTYLAAVGADAPTYDPSLPTKSWVDTSADPAQPYTYSTYIDNGLSAPPTFKSITIPGSQAAAVNLYGLHSYPPYVIAPSGAATVDATGLTNSPVPAQFLSTQDQANQLAAQLGLTTGAVFDGSLVSGIYKTVYAPTENRKIWLVDFKGVQVSAGLLLREQNANGAGAPGKWDLSGAEPNWISAVPSSLPPANPLQPVPMRQLLPNEQFNATLTGWQIVRTDMGGNGGGSTPVADPRIDAILRIVTEIGTRFGVS